MTDERHGPPTELSRRFGSGLIWQAVERLGGRGLSLLRILVLARLIAPEDFGVVAIAVVVTEVALSVSNLGVKKAVVQQDPVTSNHFDTAWTVNVVRGALIAVVLAVAARPIADLFDEPAAAMTIAILGTRPALTALASPRVPELIRGLEFRRLAVIRLTGPVFEITVAVTAALVIRRVGTVDASLGIPTDGVWAVILGALVASAAQVAASYVVAPRRPKLTLDRGAARDLLSFGRWLLIGGIFGVLATAALRAVVSRQFGVADLGLFYVAMTLAFAPGETLGGMVGTVGFPVVAQVRDSEGRRRRAFRAMLLAVALPVAAASAGLIVAAEPIADHVLGSSWEGAASLLRILGIAGIAGMLLPVLRPALRGIGRPELHTGLVVVRSVVLVGAVIALTRNYGLDGAAIAVLVAEAATTLVGVAAARYVVDSPFRGMLRPGLLVVATAIVAGVVTAGAIMLIDGPVGLVVAVVSAVVGAIAAGYALDRRFELGIADEIKLALPLGKRNRALGAGST